MTKRGKKRSTRRWSGFGRDVRYLIDRFSQEDLRTWNRMADNANRYWVGLYHHLEAQRQLNRSALIDALASTSSATIPDTPWYRLVDYAYALQPLSLLGSLTQGGRFNVGRDLDATQFPVFPALYLGSGFETAYAEKFGVVAQCAELAAHELALRTPESFAAVRARLRARRLFDLRNAANLTAFASIIRRFRMGAELNALAKKLGKKPPWLIQNANQLFAVLLATDWRALPIQFGIPANTQVFAGLLIEAGFEGVVYPSTKGNGQCVAVFPQNFSDTESSVDLVDALPSADCQRSLNCESLDELMH
mgnify:CR=1 FL=1